MDHMHTGKLSQSLYGDTAVTGAPNGCHSLGLSWLGQVCNVSLYMGTSSICLLEKSGSPPHCDAMVVKATESSGQPRLTGQQRHRRHQQFRTMHQLHPRLPTGAGSSIRIKEWQKVSRTVSLQHATNAGARSQAEAAQPQRRQGHQSRRLHP